MPFRDSFRRALKRSDTLSSSTTSLESTSSSASTTPLPQSRLTNPLSTPTTSLPNPPIPTSPPTITRTSTTTSNSNRLSLSKTLTWGRKPKLSPEEQSLKRIEEWREHDAKAWDLPPRKPNKHKSKAHQDLLRTFEMRWNAEGRRTSGASAWSGVSPGGSRVGSVDLGGGRRGVVTGMGMGPLSREVSLEDVPGSVGAVLAE